MKNIIKKIISIMLVCGFIISNTLSLNNNVFADYWDFLNATDLAIDAKAHIQNWVEAEFECIEEAKIDKMIACSGQNVVRDNFYYLHNIDHLPYNIIHILVQNHIRKNNPMLKKKELGIVYTTNKDLLNQKNKEWENELEDHKAQCNNDNTLKSVIGQLKKYVNYSGREGSIDLWAEDGDDIHIWEVKPPSYEYYPKRIIGYEQLFRYVNIPKTKIGGGLQFKLNKLNFYKGNNNLLSCPSNEFSFEWFNGNEYILYTINYNANDDGLVIYHFNRYAMKKQEQEEPETATVTDKDFEIAYSYGEIQELVSSIYGEASEVLAYETSNSILDAYNSISESILVTAKYEQFDTSDLLSITYYIAKNDLQKLRSRLDTLGKCAVAYILGRELISNIIGSTTSTKEYENASAAFLNILDDILSKDAGSVMVNGVRYLKLDAKGLCLNILRVT